MLIDPKKDFSTGIIIKRACLFMAPSLLLFALYVQFHGDLSPGGGFQAGCLIAAFYFLYAFLLGFPVVDEIFPQPVFRYMIFLGLLIYVGVGFVTILLGGNYLEYAIFGPLGQEYGLLVIEIGVALSVSGAMVRIVREFYRVFQIYYTNDGDKGDV